MATKAKKAGQEKAKKGEKPSAAPKAEKKGGKAAANTKAAAAPAPAEQPVVDADELEEQEDAAAAGSGSGGGNAAALAAANGSTEMSASFKNFRHHPDMENFFRFIYENDLRLEALHIIDEIIVERRARKKKGSTNA